MTKPLLKRLSYYFRLRSSDKHYFLALGALIGAVLFWRGLWEVADRMPFVSEPFMSIAIGLAIMTFTGVIYREVSPEEDPLTELIDVIQASFTQPERHRQATTIHFRDNVTNKVHSITHANLKGIEHNFLLLERGKKEYFIPLHRIEHIKKRGKIVWKK